jgi:hypothetical protein
LTGISQISVDLGIRYFTLLSRARVGHRPHPWVSGSGRSDVSGSAKDEASTPQKLGMYSDQSIYGHLLDESPGDWTKLGFGSVLVEAQAAGKFEVWASPTHVIETLQARELGRGRPGQLVLQQHN